MTAPGNVTATMKYVVRGEKATFHAGDRARSYWPGEDHAVTINDMRPEQGEMRTIAFLEPVGGGGTES